MKKVWHKLLLGAALAGLLATAGCAPLAQYVDPQTLRPLSRAERLFREGERLAQAGKVAEANLAYRQTIQVDPNFQPAMRRLAAAYEAQGRRRLAAYFYEQSLARVPEDNEARRALVQVYLALGKADQAAAAGAPLGLTPQPAARKSVV